MSALFPTAFSPFKIKGKSFKNRFFFAAHGTGYTESGNVGSRAFAYYEERLKNDIALLVTEAAQVVPVPGQHYNLLNLSSDASVPGMKRLAELARSYDCRFFVQLFDFGRAYGHSLDGSKSEIRAPSAMPDERFHQTPRALSVREIEALVQQFAEAANRARRAGADGVEILVGMGFLHAQFLSPRVNIREDDYGGSPAKRLKFLADTLGAIRKATDESFVIGIRTAGEEPDIDGMSQEDSFQACKALDELNLVDYVSVCVGGTHTLAGAAMIVPPMFEGTSLTVLYAQKLRAALSVPVFAGGRINQPHEAERALRDGSADMIGMVRSLIADPEFVAKAKDDRPDDIRACIACNQACIGHRHKGYGVSCIQFPETGREAEYAMKQPAKTPKRVIVVGGGPAGMKAAAVAAERGHTVTLYERSARLGGQARLAEALPGRAEFGGLTTNLEREIARYGVSVETGFTVTKDMVLELQPEAIVLATGAKPRHPTGEFDGAHVVTSWDVIEKLVNVGSNVVIADWSCDWVGLGVAELLATEGCSVRLCANGETAGQSLQSYVRHIWYGRLHRLGVEIVPFLRLFGADEDTVYMQHIMNGESVLLEDTDTLVLAYGHDSETQLLNHLRGNLGEIHTIGDCLCPRTAEEAVLEGLKVGMLL